MQTIADWLNTNPGVLSAIGLVITLLGFFVTNKNISNISQQSQKAKNNAQQHQANNGSTISIKK